MSTRGGRRKAAVPGEPVRDRSIVFTSSGQSKADPNFLIGGISGVFLSDVPADTTSHGSFFVMAHFHYTIMGGLIFAFMAGIYYWLPKMTGIKLNERLGKIQFWTMFVFFNCTFLPLFALGNMGMPRRVFEYARNLETLNDWVSVSAFLLGGSILIFLINVVWSTVIVPLRQGTRGTPAGWNGRCRRRRRRRTSRASPLSCPARTSTASRTRCRWQT